MFSSASHEARAEVQAKINSLTEELQELKQLICLMDKHLTGSRSTESGPPIRLDLQHTMVTPPWLAESALQCGRAPDAPVVQEANRLARDLVESDLILHGPSSLMDISIRLHRSSETVRSALQQLQDQGRVRRTGESRRFRYELHPTTRPDLQAGKAANREHP